MLELSKSQKKIARELIQKALQTDCKNCLDEVDSLLKKGKGTSFTPHETYLKLYDHIHKFDKYLGPKV